MEPLLLGAAKSPLVLATLTTKKAGPETFGLRHKSHALPWQTVIIANPELKHMLVCSQQELKPRVTSFELFKLCPLVSMDFRFYIVMLAGPH